MLPPTLAHTVAADRTPAMQTALTMLLKKRMTLFDILSLISLLGRSPYWTLIGTLTLAWYCTEPLPELLLAVPETTIM
jgi:hypothetical protein